MLHNYINANMQEYTHLEINVLQLLEAGPVKTYKIEYWIIFVSW